MCGVEPELSQIGNEFLYEIPILVIGLSKNACESTGWKITRLTPISGWLWEKDVALLGVIYGK